MPQLPSIQNYIFSEETDPESPVSSQLLQKIGQAINFNNDILSQAEIFTSNGTFTVPAGTTRIFVTGAGGGGGGSSSGFTSNGGGRGGDGAVPVTYSVTVSPGEVYNVTIGAGGAGGSGGAQPGLNGNNTTFLGPSVNLTFSAARGAQDDSVSRSYQNDDFRAGTIISNAGIPGAAPTNGANGQPSVFANGGLGGTASGAQEGGGGGGGGFGAGGNGGNALSTNGASAAANSSAGGGGGGSLTNGGAGGSGILWVAY